MFKAIRIVVLLALLVVAAFYTKLQRLDATTWAEPLPVVLYAIDADQRTQTGHYIAALDSERYASIGRFMKRSAERYGLLGQPVELVYGGELSELPPMPPQGSASVLSVMGWSLRLRWWVMTHDQFDSERRQVNLFVLYHDPAQQSHLPHSLGLAKGLIGIVHAFADASQNEQNNVVIAHELLHTVGATDKYDPQTNEPVFPDGFADPDQGPYPQQLCEIMAGRIPIDPDRSRMPDLLAECVVGSMTAREIHWLPNASE